MDDDEQELDESDDYYADDCDDSDEEDEMKKGDRVLHRATGLIGTVEEYDNSYIWVQLDNDAGRCYVWASECSNVY